MFQTRHFLRVLTWLGMKNPSSFQHHSLGARCYIGAAPPARSIRKCVLRQRLTMVELESTPHPFEAWLWPTFGRRRSELINMVDTSY